VDPPPEGDSLPLPYSGFAHNSQVSRPGSGLVLSHFGFKDLRPKMAQVLETFYVVPPSDMLDVSNDTINFGAEQNPVSLNW